MVMSVGLGAVAVKDRVDSDPGLGREAVRVAQIVGPKAWSTSWTSNPDARRDASTDTTHRVHNVVTSTPDASGRFPYPNATCDATPDERARDTLLPRESTNSDTLPATPRNIPGRKEARIC